jgi:hypothetical protein
MGSSCALSMVEDGGQYCTDYHVTGSARRFPEPRHGRDSGTMNAAATIDFRAVSGRSRAGSALSGPSGLMSSQNFFL